MTDYIIQIVAVPGFVTHTETLALVGQYVLDHDPDAHDGRGWLRSTPNRSDARGFADAGDAMEFWKQQSTVTPLRPDGKPNRPLTAFTVTIEQR